MRPFFIYFAQVGSEEGPIKIGYSDKPTRRVTQIQSHHWQTVHLIGVTPGDRFEEKRIHERLAKHALGREWFTADAEVFAQIAEPMERVEDHLTIAIEVRRLANDAVAHLRDSDSDSGKAALRNAHDLLIALRSQEKV